MYIACTFTDQPRSVGCSEWRSLSSLSRDAVDQPGGSWCVHTPASCTADLRHTGCSDVCTSDAADATSRAEVRATSKKRGGVRAQVAPVHPLLYTCRHRRSRSRSRDSGRSRKGGRRDRRSGSRSSRRHHKSRRRSRSGSRHRSKKSKKSRRHASSSSSSSRSPSPRRGDRTRHGSSRQTHGVQYDQGVGYQQGQQYMAPYGKPKTVFTE